MKVRAILALSHCWGLFSRSALLEALQLVDSSLSRGEGFRPGFFLFPRYFSRIFRADVRTNARAIDRRARFRIRLNNAYNSADNKGGVNVDRSNTRTNLLIPFANRVSPFFGNSDRTGFVKY